MNVVLIKPDVPALEMMPWPVLFSPAGFRANPTVPHNMQKEEK